MDFSKQRMIEEVLTTSKIFPGVMSLKEAGSLPWREYDMIIDHVAEAMENGNG